MLSKLALLPFPTGHQGEQKQPPARYCGCCAEQPDVKQCCRGPALPLLMVDPEQHSVSPLCPVCAPDLCFLLQLCVRFE